MKMATQQVYFINPNTVNSISQGVNSIATSQGIRTTLSTGTYDYIRQFMTGTLRQYYDVKMFGGVTGQVNPDDEFTFTCGFHSPTITSTGSSNLVGVSITGGYIPSATMINSVNAYNESVGSSSATLYTDDSLCVSASLGKPFYSIVLGTLVDRGILRLGDPIIQYFPNWRYMNVLEQRFYTNGTGVYSSTGLNGSIDTFLYPSTGVSGGVDEDMIITLTNGRTGTIASFMSGPTGGAASTAGSGYSSLNNYIMKVDTNTLPSWKQPFASNTGTRGVYYCEVKPIEVNKTKTYGTVAMCFSHQVGLGFTNPINKNIISTLRDRGVLNPNMGSTAMLAGRGGTPTKTTFDTNYSTYNPYYQGTTGSYTTQEWVSEIISSQMLSSMPGQVWEYDNGPILGMACCEIAYQRYYNLPYVKPIWQIAYELVIQPMGLTNDCYLKIIQMGTGSATSRDLVGERAVRDRQAAAHNTLSGSSTVQIFNPFTLTATQWGLNWQNSDIFVMNGVLLNLKAAKELAYMVANYGLARNGARILSKKYIQAMCEANYLSPECNFYLNDERPIEVNATRSADSQVVGAYDNISFGLGGFVYKPRVGKELDMLLDNPDGWYKWSGAHGWQWWVKPSEGKYLVNFHKNNAFSNPDVATGIGIVVVENYYGGLKHPPTYGNYGFDAMASSYTY